jgi:transposase-like protein
VSVAMSEAEVHWRAVFSSVPWQRCQFHLQQNAQAYVPKAGLKKEVASDIRHIFNYYSTSSSGNVTKY